MHGSTRARVQRDQYMHEGISYGFAISFPARKCIQLHRTIAGVHSFTVSIGSLRPPRISLPPKRMYSYNRVHIIGYQTQPVEVRQTPQGTSVVDLNLVVPYSFKSEGGEQLQGKSFHTITLWGPMADIAGQFVKPGTQLFVAGRLQTDQWDDPKSGEKRNKTKVIAMDMVILDPKDGRKSPPNGTPLVTECVNTAFLVGNVTRDPELRSTASGTPVVTLGVATNDKWKDRKTGEMQERSEFTNVVAWSELGKQAAQSLKKGSRVFVQGRVQTRTWQAQDGSKRATTELVADTLLLLGIDNPTALQAVAYEPKGAARDMENDSQVQAQGQETAIPAINYSSDIKVEDLPF